MPSKPRRKAPDNTKKRSSNDCMKRGRAVPSKRLFVVVGSPNGTELDPAVAKTALRVKPETAGYADQATGITATRTAAHATHAGQRFMFTL